MTGISWFRACVLLATEGTLSVERNSARVFVNAESTGETEEKRHGILSDDKRTEQALRRL